MKTIILCGLFLILCSYLTGNLILSVFKVNQIKFALPIGLFCFLGIVEVLFFPISLFKLNNYFYYYCFVFIITLIMILTLIRMRHIIISIKKRKIDIKLILVSIIFTFILLIIYKNVSLNYMKDDILYYNKLIYDKMQFNDISSVHNLYISQHYYTLLASCFVLFKSIFSNFISVDHSTIAYFLWVPAIVFYTVIPLQIFDLYSSFNKYLVKWKAFLLTGLLAIFFLSDEWVFTGIMYGNTIRPFILSMLIMILLQIDIESNKKIINNLVLFLLSSAMISVSSSSLFILFAFVFCFILTCTFLRKNNYLQNIIWICIPCFFTSLYLLSKITFLAICLIILLIIIDFFNKTAALEKFIFNFRFIIVSLFVFLLIITGLTVGKNSPISFFTDMNIDMLRPHLVYLNFFGGKIYLAFRNTIFWIFVLSTIVISLMNQKKTLAIFITLFLGCFFNPFVCKGLYLLLTSDNYYRLTDLIYNTYIFCSCLLMVAYNNKVRNLTVLIMLILTSGNLLLSVEWGKVRIEKEGFNILYKMPQKDIEVIKLLYEDYLSKENQTKVGSHIVGIELITDYKIINALPRNPNPLEPSNANTYSSVFYPQFYYQFDADYTYACAIAKENKLDYFIENAQYDWMIEEYIWPCANKLFELNNYRIWKLDFDLWNYNIKMNNSPDTRVIPK